MTAVVLTANVRDFVALAAETPHHGLLLVYREADVTKNLTIAEIALAIGKVEAALEAALDG